MNQVLTCVIKLFDIELDKRFILFGYQLCLNMFKLGVNDDLDVFGLDKSYDEIYVVFYDHTMDKINCYHGI